MASKKRIKRTVAKKEIVTKEKLIPEENLVDTTPKVEYSNNYIKTQQANHENSFPGDDTDNFDDDFWRRYIINQQEIISDLVKKNMLLNTEMQRLQGLLELQETKINISSTASEFKDQMKSIAEKQVEDTKKEAMAAKQKAEELLNRTPIDNYDKYMFRPLVKTRIAQLREKPKQEENINKQKKPKPIKTEVYIILSRKW